MEHPEGEGGSVQPNREERKEIVPGFNEEELFEFSLDQIMNGNLDERREVVEYLVDEFDEMSLCMVEGLRRFANRDATQDHQHEDEDDDETGSGSDSDEDDQTNRNEPESSTSKQTHKPSKRSTKKRLVQHDDNNEGEDISKRERQRQKYRTYWQHLKTNPVKYAKVLKRVSDYRKRRLDGMTDQERDKFYKQRREYFRNRYHNLSLEDKAKRNRKSTELKRNKRLESEEYRVKMREKDRNSKRRKWQNMTEDQRKVARQKNAEAQKRLREKKKNQK